MHFGKISLICLEVVTVVAAEQLVHDPSIGKGNTFSPAISNKVPHQPKLQLGNVFHGFQHPQRKPGRLQPKLQPLSHDHLDQIGQAVARSIQRPDLARLLHQGTAAMGSLKTEAEDGLHHLWTEVGDHYHALADNIKDKLPVVRADLKKVAPYAVPVAEIMSHLLARDIELEEELYARGLDWYLEDDE